jgi:hypothetical protein
MNVGAKYVNQKKMPSMEQLGARLSQSLTVTKKNQLGKVHDLCAETNEIRIRVC